METSFEEIYCLNQLIRSDARLNSLSSNDFYLIMWKYLQYSIADFIYDCKQNLNNYVPYSQTIYNFICDGIDGVFSLSPAPTQATKNFYIAYRLGEDEPYEEVHEYVYDSINNTITIDSDLCLEGTEVIISCYDKGKFNILLTIDEKRILSEGMIIPWLEEQLNEINLTRFAVYGGSIKMHSQAEHIGKLTTQIKEQRNNLIRLINHYSYRKNPNDLKPLGGRFYANT